MGQNFKDIITKVPSSGKSTKRTAKRGKRHGGRK